MKKISLVLLSIVLLSGCMKQKEDQKKAGEKTKKVAEYKGRGIPLINAKEADSGSFDDDVEAFVLEEEDIYNEPLKKQEGKQAKIERLTALENEKNLDTAWKQDDYREFEPVYFDFDRYDIREDQKSVVAYNAQQGKNVAQEDKVIAVDGHSDRHCISQTYNIAVSQKRAHTVCAELAKEGVPKENLKPVGHGASRVAIDNPGKEPRNRRVELRALTTIRA